MRITYKLHDSQHQVFSDESRFVVVTAGRRFGKTVLAVMRVIKTAFEIPKATIWIVCPTYKQAEMIAWKMLFEMIPRELIASKNEVKLQINLINGSEICLKGCDNEDGLRGTSCDLIIMDEFGDMKRHVWFEVLRPMLSDRRGKAMFIGTPKGKNHFWELFVKGEKKEDGYSSYKFKTEDNPYIPRAEIAEARTQLSDRQFRQEYEANFEDFSGMIYPEFSHKQHIIEPFAIPESYKTIGAIDPAVTGTFASLMAAVDGDGTLFITNEFYEQNKRVSEVSDAIRGKAGRWYMDPAGKIARASNAGGLYNFFDEFRDQNIHPFPAQNSVMAGINHTAEFFKAGKIKIFSNCKNLVHELDRYHWADEKETSGGMLEPKPFKSMDHLCDCLRYLVMSRVQPPEPVEKIVTHSADWWEKQAKEQEQFREDLERLHQ